MGQRRIYARALTLVLAIAIPLLALTSPARAAGPNAIVSVPSAGSTDTCRDTTLARNDDGSTGAIALPFVMNFFGVNYGQVYVNNNGNLTFTGPMSTYTPFPIQTTATPIIAPFFADVDTRGALSSPVTYSGLPAGQSYGWGTFGGRPTFCANWVNVGYYSGGTDKLNSFQVLLVDRSDVGAGDFDIVFNYDQIQWEAGSASGGRGGLGGSPARVGYSNGVRTSFELPGSGVVGAFLDSNNASGLTHNSRNSLQLGRYIFNVRSGAAPTGGTIQGTVFRNSASAGNELPGAFVQACGTSGSCNLTTTSANGGFTFSGLADGTYTLTANPPGGTSLSQATRGGVAIANANTLTGQDLVVTGPTPLPPGTTITHRAINADGLPILYWMDDLTLTTQGCVGGTASYVVTQNAAIIRSGPMTEGPAGTYTAILPHFYPTHGYIRVIITIVCGAVTTETAFDAYIDPSGTVRTTTGQPIANATVRLLRSDSSSGPFVAVPDGSGIMSPANRHNPDTTDANGHFGWDVLAGFYVVEASATSCVSPTDPTQTVVRSAVLSIPPAVTDLDLRFSCPSLDTTAPVSTAAATPAANGNGWNNTDVTVAITATDETGGSGVRDISYGLAGAQTLADTAYPGASVSTTITAEGTTTVTYHATDNASNAEAPHTLAINIDKTAPAVTGTATPAANANGWNNTPVAVHFSATDAGSGIDGASAFDATLSSAGAGRSATHSFTDRAGNTGSATVSGINIDLTKPATTATTSPAANAAGWWHAPVAVSLAATDDLSGVASTEVSVDGGAFSAYAAAVTVTGDGVHTLTFRSTDRAGNVEDTKSLTVSIDTTAPEGAFRFDDTAKDLVFVARDGGSGPTSPLATVTVVPGPPGREREDHRELRAYHVSDKAGNTIDVTVLVKREGHELKATVVSTSYNGAAPILASKNEIGDEWSVNRTGAIQQLEQGIELDRIAEAEAHYSAAKSQTKIQIEQAGTERSFTRPGLSFLRLATSHGTLSIETD